MLSASLNKTFSKFSVTCRVYIQFVTLFVILILTPIDVKLVIYDQFRTVVRMSGNTIANICGQPIFFFS